MVPVSGTKISRIPIRRNEIEAILSNDQLAAERPTQNGGNSLHAVSSSRVRRKNKIKNCEVFWETTSQGTERQKFFPGKERFYSPCFPHKETTQEAWSEYHSRFLR